MFPNNPSFMERLVQATQEERLRGIRGINEGEFLNASEPIVKLVLKPRVLKAAGAFLTLAWLVHMFS